MTCGICLTKYIFAFAFSVRFDTVYLTLTARLPRDDLVLQRIYFALAACLLNVNRVCAVRRRRVSCAFTACLVRTACCSLRCVFAVCSLCVCCSFASSFLRVYIKLTSLLPRTQPNPQTPEPTRPNPTYPLRRING